MKAPQRDSAYDNAFSPITVYGHALELLKRQWAGPKQGLHLDVGCGFGRIAEPLVEALGRTYVGCDVDDVGLASLSARGFETHRLELSGEEFIYQALTGVIAGRPVASMTIIDTLEHVYDPVGTMRALRRIAEYHGAAIVISVPNTAHRDLGLRLLFGRWDYTEAGILDYTHRFLFSDSVLRRMLAYTGFRIVDDYDVEQTVSDQAFPPDHPVFQRGSQLFQVLATLRENADSYGKANQLVRLCVPNEPETIEPFVGRDDGRRPFLSIVMRTQGTRIDSLTEVLTCVAGQSSSDFELLILGHKVDAPRWTAVGQVVSDLPTWMRGKTRMVQVDHGGRAAPLNIGFELANGQYIVILDDDDTIFGNWIEAFMERAATAPGQIIRSVAVTQTIDRIDCRGVSALRAESGLDRPYPSDFDWFDTLRVNRSPGMTLAFPRGVFHHLGIKFDEDLTTTEDWDFLLRSAALVGAAGTPEITAIYRFWAGSDSSMTDHSKNEWTENYDRIVKKMDRSLLVVWPAGTTKRIRDLMNNADGGGLLSHGGLPMDSDGNAESFTGRMEALREVVNVFNSTSWKLTAPLRLLGRLAGKPGSSLNNVWWLSTHDLRSLATTLRQSTSWRLSAPLRRWKW